MLLSPNAHLKYRWGTSYVTIARKEEVTQEGGSSLTCRDREHEIDELTEFVNTSRLVTYLFDEDSKLCGITYNYANLYKDYIAVLSEHYGEDCYEKDYYCYWLVGNTLVEWKSGTLTYYARDYALELAQNDMHYALVMESLLLS